MKCSLIMNVRLNKCSSNVRAICTWNGERPLTHRGHTDPGSGEVGEGVDSYLLDWFNVPTVGLEVCRHVFSHHLLAASCDQGSIREKNEGDGDERGIVYSGCY